MTSKDSDPTANVGISDEEFSLISRTVHERFGIVLTEEKRALVVGRLRCSLAKRGVETFTGYLKLLANDKDGTIHSELINQLSTNFTSFFREPDHFAFFAEKALPDALQILHRKRSNDLRIWCAACATGEEAYTIQMTMLESLGTQYAAYNAGLLATDISARALAVAQRSVYSHEQLGTVPPTLKKRYFRDLGEGQLVAKDNVRNQILFRRLNLMNPSFPFRQPFHVIFVRNVMIYFDDDTRSKLVAKLCDLLVPGGYLFIGHSESINSEWAKLKLIQSAVYQKAG